MKKNKQDIEKITKKLDRYIQKQLGRETVTPGEWDYMRKAKKRTLKKIIIGGGISGFIFYLVLAVRGFVSKVGLFIATHKIISIVLSLALISATGYLTIVFKPAPASLMTTTKQLKQVVPQVLNRSQKRTPVKKSPVTHLVGISPFASNHGDTAFISAIAQKIVAHSNARKGRAFSRTITGDKSNTRYLLTGIIDDHENGYFLLTLKLVDTRTSRILDMETVNIDNKEKIEAACIKTADKLFKKIQ